MIESILSVHSMLGIWDFVLFIFVIICTISEYFRFDLYSHKLNDACGIFLNISQGQQWPERKQKVIETTKGSPSKSCRYTFISSVQQWNLLWMWLRIWYFRWNSNTLPFKNYFTFTFLITLLMYTYVSKTLCTKITITRET